MNNIIEDAVATKAVSESNMVTKGKHSKFYACVGVKYMHFFIADHLEVTGVSRSGRVCKKSSKLMDFQAADDSEAKPKRTPAKKPPSTPKFPNTTTTKSTKRNDRKRDLSKLDANSKMRSNKNVRTCVMRGYPTCVIYVFTIPL